jgi:hypothetical protein
LNWSDPNGASVSGTYLEPGGIIRAKTLILFVIYYELDFTPRLTTQQRDQIIRDRYSRGEAISDLAREYGISPQRVFQIVNPKPPAR